MSRTRTLLLTAFAMLAFAGNSLLCRLALKHTDIDAASFTTIRLVSGALMLWLLVSVRRGIHLAGGSWVSASALFIYAAGFSFAYVSLPASTGSLLLFGAVQVTMIGYGAWTGERLRAVQVAGAGLAFAGLLGLLVPGLSAPPLFGSILMLVAGVAWGVYSLRGRGSGDPTEITAGNFMRAGLITIAMSALMIHSLSVANAGVWYAMASGALASGIGYAVWYMALPRLRAAPAATVQLSVPVQAALGGIVFLGESLSVRLVLASVAILGGIALVILDKQQAA